MEPLTMTLYGTASAFVVKKAKDELKNLLKRDDYTRQELGDIIQNYGVPQSASDAQPL